jgi:hypothetical protein
LFMDNVDGSKITAEVFDCLGKKITSYKIDKYQRGKVVSIDCKLHGGVYFLKHTIDQTGKAVIVTFMVNK